MKTSKFPIDYLHAGKLWILTLIIMGLSAGCEKESANSLSTDLAPAEVHKVIWVHKGESIQKAIDEAKEGDTIKIEPATYLENLIVSIPRLSIIGYKSPNGDCVIIKNPGNEEDGIRVNRDADNFHLENVTVRDFKENGVFLIGVEGFILRKVDTYDNGEYGLFPVRSSKGIIEYCISSGHSDTGIYIGQSEDVTMNNNVAYGNVNGLEVENASNMRVKFNHCYDNVVGLLVALLPGLTVKSSSDIYVSDNTFENNNHVNFAPPEGGFEAVVPSGLGLLVLGCDKVNIERNKIRDNNFSGIAVFSTLALGAIAGLPPEAFADIEPNPDGIKVISNSLKNNGSKPPLLSLPLPGVDLLWDGSGKNNCWNSNTYRTSFPAILPTCP